MKIGDKWISLNALQTFEVTARHEHMGRAAQELNVTPSAISHQVRSLEQSLGVELFDRQGRRIVLNPTGARLLLSIRQGFDTIASTALSLSADAYSDTFTLAVPVSLMVEWLNTKLSVFLQRFPNLSLKCVYSERTMTALPPDVDMGIVFGAHVFAGCTVTPFIRPRVFPVCAPRLVRGPLPLDASVLRQATIIHEDDGDIWAQWFASRGVEQFRPAREIHAGSLHDAMAFARAGAGFAITDWFLGGKALSSGALVQPFGRAELVSEDYYIVTRTNHPKEKVAEALSSWLLREARNELITLEKPLVR